MNLALDLFVQAWAIPRTERSTAYKNGTKAALVRIFEGAPAEAYPAPGTAEFDAYIAGRQEGHQIAAEHIKACPVWEGGL